MVKCYNCKKELDLKPDNDLPRSEECPHCSADLRCCKMCKFYDPKAYNECREPMAERVTEKEKSNFCGYFKVASDATENDNKSDLLAQANALFKK